MARIECDVHLFLVHLFRNGSRRGRAATRCRAGKVAGGQARPGRHHVCRHDRHRRTQPGKARQSVFERRAASGYDAQRNPTHIEVRAGRVNPESPAPAVPGGCTAGTPSAPCHREPRHG